MEGFDLWLWEGGWENLQSLYRCNIGEGIKRSPIKDSFLCDKGKMSRKSQEENAGGRYNRARKEERQR